jgi:tetratricopeptide (TPR) repeat protein
MIAGAFLPYNLELRLRNMRCRTRMQVDSSIYLRLSRPLCLISFPVILVLSIGSVTLPAQQKPSGTTAVVSELRQGNNQRALSLANRSLAANPRDCGLLSLKAVALTGLNQPQLALQSFRKALASCPSYLPALEGASQIKYAEHSPETAALLNRILTLQPDNGSARGMASDRAQEAPYLDGCAAYDFAHRGG